MEFTRQTNNKNLNANVNRRDEFIWVFLLISVLIIGFNFPDIFSARTMMEDDNQRFVVGLDNKVYDLIFKRNTLRAYVLSPLYKLLTVNLVYARLAQTVLFYIPLSFSIYCLIRIYAKVPAQVALFASILPCILPGQTQIPSFIDGSYTVQGLLVFVIMLHVSLRFLARKNVSWFLYLAVLALYGISLEMMDHSIFLAPVAIVIYFLFAINRNERKKIIGLSLAIVGLAGVKAIQIINFPTVPSSVPVKPSIAVFANRFSSLASDTLPFAYSLSNSFFDGRILWYIFFVIILCAMIRASNVEKKLIGIGLFWAFCSSIVFLTISRFYAPRLAHIPGFGINFALVISLWVIIENVKLKHRSHFIFLILTFLVLYSGVSRLNVMRLQIQPGNVAHDAVLSQFRLHDFPEYSQIVVFNVQEVGTQGWWEYSSGYLKYATGRPDITGLVGPEFNFYNPFDSKKRGYRIDHMMNGLSLEYPVFVFRVNKSNGYSLLQAKYVLQWLKDGWKIYKLNMQNGSIEEVFSGITYNQLTELLQEKNIPRDNVAFARGKPSN